MGLTVMAILAFGLTAFVMPGAKSVPCPSGTVDINISSTADVDDLTDALACVGQGIFNITWHTSLTIDEMIKVSDEKNLTVTAGDFTGFRGVLGDDNAAGVTIDAGNGKGIFSVSDGSTLRLNNIGLEGGNAEDGGAVAVLSSSALFVFGCAFTCNNASNGGALFASNSTIYVNGSTSFDDNSALFGGAVYADESDIYIDGKTYFAHNSAKGSSVKIVSSSISSGGIQYTMSTSNTSSGGAIYANASVVNIDGDTYFADNFAYFQGGAIYAEESSIRVDEKTSFSNNSAQGATLNYLPSNYNVPGARGGAIGATASEVFIDGDTSWAYNFAVNGGAIYARVSEIRIDGNALFTNNSAGADGGVIYAQTSEVGIDGNSMFTNNTAGDDGGAIYARESEIRIDGNASFNKNSAVVSGGVVKADESNISLNGNTEMSNNYATDYWGGVIYSWNSEVGIHGNTSFTNNSSPMDGGVLFAFGSNVSLDGNTEFSRNYAGSRGGAVYVTFNSKIGIDGNALFTHNSASEDAGAIYVETSNVTINGGKTLRGDLTGAPYSETGGDYTSNRSVVFVDNSAHGLGGAIFFQKCDQVQVSDVIFKSNEASLGGAVYILAEDDKRTIFSKCLLEGNTAADGGAVYLYTGPGVDTFTGCVFRNNFAGTSGGAIFHTGSLRVINTSFVANVASVEGPGIMSVGHLQELSNVSFAENTYFCRVGKYGFIDKNEDSVCLSCFDEVCSRCSTVRDGASIREEVRIDGKPVCEKQPLGAAANSGGTTVANLTLKTGYFRTSNQSHVILQCYRKSACQGGKDADQYCAPGYTGPYCAVCAKKFAPGIAYSCRECSPDITRSAVGLSVAMGVAVLLCAGVLLSYLGNVGHDWAEGGIARYQSLWKNKYRTCPASLVNMLPVRAIKIVVTVWQIISQFDAIAGDVYPELYQTFVSKINPINLDLEFVFSYSCLVRNDFYDHLVFVTITPLLALVVLAGSYYIGTSKNSSSQSAIREVRLRHQAAVLFISFVVYSPVSYRIFQTFGCDELDNGETYLRADYSISCLTARHSWYKVYAFIMVAVYPIGIAAAFAGLLIWHRRDLVKPGRGTMLHLKPFTGVWAAYKPSRYYYEVVECGRRIALTAIAAFVLPKSTAQISIAVLFAMVHVFISEVLSPFQKGIDMGLYRWGNGIIVASMYVAFLKKIDVDEDTASAEYLLTFSGVLIAANVFMVVTVLVQAVLLAKEMYARTNAVRVRDIPVRRTHSVSLRGLRSVTEGGVYREGDDALESKDSEI